jgi:type I restriction enzyme, S subunit
MEAEVCFRSPTDWAVRAIGDVCARVTSGGTPSRSRPEFYDGGTWPWVKTQELRDGWIDETEEHITDEAIAESSSKILPANTVLLALYGATVGQLGLLRRRMACNQACCAMIVDDTRADFRYLYYQLLAARSQLKRMATGAAQQNISGDLIRNFEFPFPELTEQRAIAHILGTLDDKIELNRRMNETLEAIARALFKSWFVDFDPVRAKVEGRDTGLPAAIADLFPDSFEDSELGEIPKGWEVGPLDGVLVLQRGFDLPATERTPGAYPVLAASGPSGTHDEFMARGPGVTTGRSGVLGRVFYVDSDFWPLNTSLWVKEFRHSRPAYAFHLLREIDFRLFNAGSAVPTLNRNHVHTLPTLRPSMALINKFETVATESLDRQRRNEGQSTTLAAVRDALLPKLISGELRVKDAARFADGGD